MGAQTFRGDVRAAQGRRRSTGTKVPLEVDLLCPPPDIAARSSSDDEVGPALSQIRRASFGSQTLRGMSNVNQQQKEKFSDRRPSTQEQLQVGMLVAASASVSDSDSSSESQEDSQPGKFIPAIERRRSSTAPKEELQVGMILGIARDDDGESTDKEVAEIVAAVANATPARRSFGSQTVRGARSTHDVTKKQKDIVRNEARVVKEELPMDLMMPTGGNESDEEPPSQQPIPNTQRRSVATFRGLRSAPVNLHKRQRQARRPSSSMIPRVEIQVGILGCTNSSSDDNLEAVTDVIRRRHSFGAQTMKGLQDVDQQQRELWRPAAEPKPKETMEVSLMMPAGSGSSSSDEEPAEVEPPVAQPRRTSLGAQTLRGVPKALEKEAPQPRRGSGMPKEPIIGIDLMIPVGDESESDLEEPAVPVQSERRSSFGSHTLRGVKNVTQKQKEVVRRTSKGKLNTEAISGLMIGNANSSSDDEKNDEESSNYSDEPLVVIPKKSVGSATLRGLKSGLKSGMKKSTAGVPKRTAKTAPGSRRISFSEQVERCGEDGDVTLDKLAKEKEAARKEQLNVGMLNLAVDDEKTAREDEKKAEGSGSDDEVDLPIQRKSDRLAGNKKSTTITMRGKKGLGARAALQTAVQQPSKSMPQPRNEDIGASLMIAADSGDSE